eukprot:GGOE01044290.1.p1 GENE.GGOE01044290.1~~GGOE01044290.1.p1  ORF type:complete len:559 (-),score=113.86 GGOE01044290.1:335-1990(-)
MSGWGTLWLLLLLLWLCVAGAPNGALAPSVCEEVPWQPRRSVLFVTHDLHHKASNQLAVLQVAETLAADFTVEVAMPATGPMQEEYRRLGWHSMTLHTLDPTNGSLCNTMKEVAKLFMQQRYIGLVWSVPDLWTAHRCIQPLPGAYSMLWVLEDHWPEGQSAAETDWMRVLAFDHVVFGTKEMMAKYAALVNPAGHLPISFLLFNSINRTVSVTMAFSQRLVTCLRHWAGDEAGSFLKKIGQAALVDTAEDGLDRVKTCPSNSFTNLAVVVHLGRHQAKRLQRILSAMKGYPHSVHIWVTYTRMGNRGEVLSLLNHQGAVIHPLMVRDHGLDLGPFFIFLWQLARCHYQYSYILKYHFKTNDEHGFTQQAAVFFRHHGFLAKAVSHLDLHRHVSAVYPRIEGLEDLVKGRGQWEFFGHNYWHLHELYYTLAVPVPRDGFLAGSVWLTRTSVLTRWLHTTAQLWAIYADLNDPMGLDWRWYNRVVLRADCNRSTVQLLYFLKGVPRNLPPNCYAPIPGYFELERDGMVEHAWERFLSWMFSFYGPFDPLIVK